MVRKGVVFFILSFIFSMKAGLSLASLIEKEGEAPTEKALKKLSAPQEGKAGYPSFSAIDLVENNSLYVRISNVEAFKNSRDERGVYKPFSLSWDGTAEGLMNRAKLTKKQETFLQTQLLLIPMVYRDEPDQTIQVTLKNQGKANSYTVKTGDIIPFAIEIPSKGKLIKDLNPDSVLEAFPGFAFHDKSTELKIGIIQNVFLDVQGSLKKRFVF